MIIYKHVIPSGFFIVSNSYAILACILLVGQSCQKDQPPVKDDTATITGSKRVFITNEGNFNWGNASLSLYNPDNNTVTADIYKTNNNNNPLGDVCQSMTRHNNALLVVVNNSHKVIALNYQTYIKEHEITGLNSPRYILPVSNSKAYISDLYNNTIYIADLNTWSVSATIPCKGWTEEMALSYGKAFVCNRKSNYLYVINTASDQVTDSIAVGYGSSSIQKDKNEKLWVLCSGSSSLNQLPKLVRVNPLNNQVELSLVFTANDSPGNLQLNGAGDHIYYLNHGVYTMHIADLNLPASAFISEGTKIYYGIGIDPEDETIYVSDAIDYVQKGKIERYTPTGIYINTFTAGITPGSFYFQY